MKIEKRNIKKQLFICTNIREESASCGAKDSTQLLKNLKKRLKSAGLWGDYKVTKSGCLGPCKQGIAAALHPDNLLITEISLDDEDKLYDLLTKA